MSTMTTVNERGIIGRIAAAVAVFGLLSACGGDDSSSGSNDDGSATTAEAGPTDLPKTVTISAWPDSAYPATGTATVAQDGDDVTLTVEVTTETEPPFYAALILAGTCDGQPESPDFSAALDQDTVTGDETKGELTASADGLTDGPHVLLVTTASGEQNLGCGQITS